MNDAIGEIRVFVYGSLKKGFSNHCVLDGARFVDNATLDGGYRMVSLGGFPGVLKDEGVDRVITGEVYVVDADGLVSLDILEGNGSFYTRSKVKTSDGLKVWCYFLPEEYAEEQDVESGIWEEFWQQHG